MQEVGVHRRLSAILVADVVGYSRLIGQDEGETLRRLKRLRREIIDPKILAFHGRVVKVSGDGILVEVPSTVDAVGCAVAVQQAMAEHNAEISTDQQIAFRVGIHQGDIVVDGQDILGDGVNVAARLETMCVPGGICVSGVVYDEMAGRLVLPFEDRGEQQVKNIARPIRVYALSAETISTLTVPPASAGAWQRRSRANQPVALVGVFVVVLLLAGAGWLMWQRFAPNPARDGELHDVGTKALTQATPTVSAALNPSSVKPGAAPRLSIVVLPFQNLSDDPQQEYFVDGITDDLTTDLSRIDGSFVIARNSAFTYRGKSVDVREIGRELGVRYALEGSVRRIVTQVRVNAQLIDTESGAHLWADRFDGDPSHLAELQDQITSRLASSLGVALTEAESLRFQREKPAIPDAVDLSMRGWSDLNKPPDAANAARAQSFFEQAMRLDPQYTPALVGLAYSLTRQQGNDDFTQTNYARAEDLIDKALEILPGNARAHFVKGNVLQVLKRFEPAIREYETAIAYDRNNAPAYAHIGVTKILSGHSAEAFAPVETALRLSPRDAELSLWLFFVCHAHTHLAQWQQAIEWCGRSVAVYPLWLAYVDLAAGYAWTGQSSEAHEAVTELTKMMPGYTVKKWASADWSDNPTFLAEYQRIVEGLRKAGLTEE
jgi:adenylate cyclase